MNDYRDENRPDACATDRSVARSHPGAAAAFAPGSDDEEAPGFDAQEQVANIARACGVRIDRVSITVAEGIEEVERFLDVDLAAEIFAAGQDFDMLVELPRWVGPGAEAGALLDMLGPEPTLSDYTDAYVFAEKLITWARYLQVATAARMLGAMRSCPGTHASPSPGLETDELVASAVTDELCLATGAKRGQVEAQVAYARRSSGPQAGAFTRLTETLRDAAIPWERVTHTETETRGQDYEATEAIVDRILKPAREGTCVSWESHRGRLARALRRFGRPEVGHRRAVRDRHTWARLDENGTGTFAVTGTSERVVAACERVENVARTLKAGGDTRTLGQLRSDIALDLLISGSPLHGTYPGPVPAGRVSVSVSLASLVGATHTDGETRYGPLPAHVVRDIALAEGTVLARIVSDPVTGIALDATTERYRPTDSMRRYLVARHRWCTAPGCAQPAETCDLDHTVPWPRGATSPANLGPRHRRHHEYKTRGWWHATQDPDGTTHWRTLAGREYTVRPHRYDIDLVEDADDITRIPIHPCGCTFTSGRPPSTGEGGDIGAHLDPVCHPDDPVCHPDSVCHPGSVCDPGRCAGAAESLPEGAGSGHGGGGQCAEANGQRGSSSHDDGDVRERLGDGDIGARLKGGSAADNPNGVNRDGSSHDDGDVRERLGDASTPESIGSLSDDGSGPDIDDDGNTVLSWLYDGSATACPSGNDSGSDDEARRRGGSALVSPARGIESPRGYEPPPF